MSLLHPSIRMPSWVAVAVVAAAFVVRAWLAGWDFRPQLPGDLIIIVGLFGLLGLREYLRRRGWDARPDGAAEVDADAVEPARSGEDGPPAP